MNPFEQLIQMIFGGGAQAAQPQTAPQQAQLLPGDRPLEGGPAPAPPPPPPGPVMTAQANVPPVVPPNFRSEEPGTFGSALGGTLRNWGMFRGSPSATEYQAGERQQSIQMEAGAKEAMASVLPEIERIRQQHPGAAPHEINKLVMASPAFLQSAMKVPANKMQEFVSGLVAQSSAPPPTPFGTGGAGSVYGTIDPATGKRTIQGSVPSADVQKLQHLQTLPAGLRAELLSPRKAPSEKKVALDHALAKGYINDFQHTMAMGELVKSESKRDENGAVIESGYTIPNLPQGPGQGPGRPGAPAQAQPQLQENATPTPWATKPQAQVPQEQQQAQAQPGQVPSQTQGRPPEISDQSTGGGLINDPTEVFDVSSFGGKLATGIGGVTGNVGPKYAPERLDYAQSKILAMKRAARALKDSRSFKVEIQDLDKQLPDENSFFSNPVKAINQTIAYRETLENKRNQILAFTQNSANPIGLRREAQQLLPSLSAAEAAIPGTMDQLKARRALLRENRGGVGVSEVLKTIPSLGEAAEVVDRGSKGIRDKAAAKQTKYPETLRTLNPKGLAAEEMRPGKSLHELRALEQELMRRAKGGR